MMLTFTAYIILYMLNKLFKSNLRVQISNGCLIGPVTKLIKTMHVNVFHNLLLYIDIVTINIIRYFNLKIRKHILL